MRRILYLFLVVLLTGSAKPTEVPSDEEQIRKLEDGLRYMRVVQAVFDSRARNEWVAIKS